MATIISVHGTFAANTEDGDDWWQRGSAFEQDIRKFVEPQDQVLTFRPYTWDGTNSELSRRAAAKGLLECVRELNGRNESYCLIGHSHGGSIVARAVFDLSSDKPPTNSLSRWITVGTPFISMTKRRLLLSRLGLIGKTLYLTFFLLSMWAAAMLIYSVATPNYARKIARREDIETTWDASLIIRLFFIALVASLPFVLTHYAFWLVELRRMHIHSRKRWQSFSAWAAPRWAGFWHSADEAVGGLKAVPQISFPIFSDRFLVAPVSLATVFLAPPVLAFGLSWLLAGQEGIPSDGSVGVSPLGSDNPFSALGILFERLKLVYGAIFLGPPSDSLGALLGPRNDPPLANVVAAVTLAFAFVLSALLLLAIVTLVSRGLSLLLSQSLDRFTWAQLRQSAFGNDTIAEIAAGADTQPMWYGKSPPPLPPELSRELSARADLAAALSLAKLRGAVQLLAFSE